MSRGINRCIDCPLYNVKIKCERFKSKSLQEGLMRVKVEGLERMCIKDGNYIKIKGRIKDVKV